MTNVPEARPLLDAQKMTVAELLASYSAILDELRRREIVRSFNSPLSDYAELLFCTAFNWSREGNSAAGHDAKDSEILKYQVKGRRLARRNASRKLSAIRNLDATPFDFLFGVLVGENFQIIRAALVPIAVVRLNSVRKAHTNSWKFMLRDDIWNKDGVTDVTAQLRNAASVL